MGLIINNINAREVFRNAQMALINANASVPGFDVSVFKLTQGFLRLEQLAVTNRTQYVFPVLINQEPKTNNEQRLNLQDSFVIAEIGVFLCKKAAEGDTAFVSQTYPNPTVFTTGAPELTKLYNGQLEISVNNNVLLPAWDIDRHYNAPRTQTPTVSNNLSVDGFYPMEPNIILVGSKNNRLVLTLGEAFDTVDPFTYIQLYFRGVLAQNSTNVS